MPVPQQEETITSPVVNVHPATAPKQVDLTKMPFVAGQKLFYSIDNDDFVDSGIIFMNGNLCLPAARCV